MQKFTFDLTLQANSPKEAQDKAKALAVLAQKLSAKHLTGLAHVVANDPAKTKLGIQYLGL